MHTLATINNPRFGPFAIGRERIAKTGRGLDSWNTGFQAIFLAEYYLATGDAEVLPGIHRYSLALSRSQSLYGTFGHKGSMLESNGGFNGSIPWYGPVNSAGLPANLAIVLGKKAIMASGGVVDQEIDPAIARAANFFGYFVNKGGIPYGEHEPWLCHADNGKSGTAAVMFAVMGDKILFNTQPFRTAVRNEPAALFHQAVRVGLEQPDGRAHGHLARPGGHCLARATTPSISSPVSPPAAAATFG